MNKGILKKQTGITMIALIVTIIVLIILAGITVGELTKDNSVIKKAENTKEQTEQKGIKEQIETAILQVEQEKADPTLNDIIQKLIEMGIIENESAVDKSTGEITVKGLSNPITGMLDDYKQT